MGITSTIRRPAYPYPQLGPVVRSSTARELRLHVSTLERLMGAKTYLAGEIASQPIITVLRKNYRSHEKLLEFPSARFYGKQLETCADKAVVDSLLGWDELPNQVSWIVLRNRSLVHYVFDGNGLLASLLQYMQTVGASVLICCVMNDVLGILKEAIVTA